jgi:thiol-disulfide isomerase/thioredoxin
MAPKDPSNSDGIKNSKNSKNSQRNASPQFLIVAFCIVLVMLATSFALRKFASTPTANGQRLTGLELQPLAAEDTPVTNETVEGKVALINFWGTWCYPCRVELPELIKLAENYKDRDDFLFLPVSCPKSPATDIESAKIETAEFLEEHEYTISCYYDARNTTRAAVADTMKLGNSFGYPTTLIVDREGKIQGFWRGYSKKVIREQQQLLDKLLKE